MFSDNQILSISGEIGSLPTDLDFAIRKSGYHSMFTRKDEPVICGYQIAKNNMYCIGAVGIRTGTYIQRDDIDRYWNAYMFDYDPEIIGRIIEQWLAKQPPINPDVENLDGQLKPGYLLQDVWSLNDTERKAIRNINTSILVIKPYLTHYGN